MTKPRRKPHNPAQQTTDTGPDTAAQRYGAIYRPTKDGRPGEILKYRLNPLQAMQQAGELTVEEEAKGLAALDLYEKTQLSPGGIGEYVDKSANSDLSTVLQCDAGFAYAKAVSRIPHFCRPTFNHVVERRGEIDDLPRCKTDADARARRVLLLKWALRELVV